MASQALALQQRSLSETKITSWSHTDFEEYELSHVWTISNFSDKSNYFGSGTLQSPSFSYPGRDEQWILKLTPSCLSSNTYYTNVNLCLQEVGGGANPPKIWIKCKISIPPRTGSSSVKEIVTERSSYFQLAKGSDYTFRLAAQNTFTNKDNGYLVNDTLSVYCTIFVKLLDTPKHSSGVISRVPNTEFSLSSKLNEARQKGAFTDVVLVAGTKSLKAHRSVLAVQSSFFNSRFQERWDQGSSNTVQMSDITPETLENMLEFMYTGHCDISSNADVLLPAAQEYGVENLLRACEQKLSEKISCQNVLSLLVLADTHRALHLKAVCLDFFVSHSSLLLKSSEWEEFEKVKDRNPLRLEVLDKLIKQKIAM